MKSKLLLYIIIFSCAACRVSKTYPKVYYAQNEKLLQEMQQVYSKINAKQSIAIAFTDWQYDNMQIDIKTDTIKYVYDFTYKEARLNDTLQKYGYDTALVQTMISYMRKARCTWINTLDYYVEDQKNTLLFMAVNAKRFFYNLKSKYYLFNFYEQPQYYDAQGRLLNKKKLKQIRKVNNETFWRINDKVCYTISSKFR